ncbi:hypothetical protein OB955_12000 [Halobacteria archaeon AArc-m2/3/4]|uniref:Uncharacterized protein n=1 Tax=Natronoglomus mannanivorans TaxID=2979990 RepID=A0AAP2Z1P5_9EURY|nr:hypothetical protein [Halobacteria archaeon AArc-xg1-1]MCU4973463.1 hypothetical protein [Halobacteria archaeon AArc-m2/3/4]
MGILRSASRTVVGVDVLILLLLAFTFLFVDPGTGAYVVATLTLVPTVLTFVAALLVLYTGWDPF